MKTEDIPYDYTYCYATDEQCPKAVHCLCSHAARQMCIRDRVSNPFIDIPSKGLFGTKENRTPIIWKYTNDYSRYW